MSSQHPVDDRTNELLIRLDERTAAIIADIAELKKSMVPMTTFKPVQAVVFGMVALIMAGVLTGLLSLLLRNG